MVKSIGAGIRKDCAILRVFASPYAAISVSYTHLDVYKRQEPGRTRELIFFSLKDKEENERLRIVDLPGYGYAKACLLYTSRCV